MIDKKDIIHFCGIGGIGMSGIAKLMDSDGYIVQGSDISDIDFKDTNIKVFNKQIGENLLNVKHFVYSSAIKPNNLEFEYAIKNNIKMWHRSDILGYLMQERYGIVVSGTHGKTTTTALLAHLFLKCNINATSLIGGMIKSLENNCLIGKTGNGYILVEGDESDKSFLKFNKKISIVTNVDLDHMENYDNNPDILFQAFADFINTTDKDGICILCADSQFLKENISPMLTHKNIVWYSCEKKDNAILAQNIKFDTNGFTFDIKFFDKTLTNIQVPLFGTHNVANALAVIIAANYMKIDFNLIKQNIQNFSGVKRRFDIIGEFCGATIIDDYAHHPVEIITTLKAVRNRYKNNRIIAILQPHRYSRVKQLFNEFGNCLNESDVQIVTDIYSAFENKSEYENLSYLDLIDLIKQNTKKDVIAAEKLLNIPNILKNIIKPNDIVILLGAGDMSEYMRSFLLTN